MLWCWWSLCDHIMTVGTLVCDHKTWYCHLLCDHIRWFTDTDSQIFGMWSHNMNWSPLCDHITFFCHIWVGIYLLCGHITWFVYHYVMTYQFWAYNAILMWSEHHKTWCCYHYTITYWLTLTVRYFVCDHITLIGHHYVIT